MTIPGMILRALGAELTWAQLDGNFTAIKRAVEAWCTQFENGTKRAVVFSKTAPAEKGVLWGKLSDDGSFAGILWWNGSAWSDMLQRTSWFGVDTATVAGQVILKIDGLNALAAGQSVVWVNLLANTGAVTAAVNGGTPIPVVDTGGSPLEAGELPAGHLAVAVYSGTNLRLVNPANTGLPALHKIATSTELGIPAVGATVSYTHGLPAAPNKFDCLFICKTANNGYAVGDLIRYTEITTGGSNDERPAFILSAGATATNLAQFNGPPTDRNFLHKTNGVPASFDQNQWKAIFVAELIR